MILFMDGISEFLAVRENDRGGNKFDFVIGMFVFNFVSAAIRNCDRKARAGRSQLRNAIGRYRMHAVETRAFHLHLHFTRVLLRPCPFHTTHDF